MKKTLIFLAVLLIVTGCGAKTGLFGAMDGSAGSYAALVADDGVTQLEYYADGGLLDNNTSPNYVSQIVSAMPLKRASFMEYLVSSSAIAPAALDKSYKKHMVYYADNDVDKLALGDFRYRPVSVNAKLIDGIYSISLDKSSLVLYATVSPTLSITSFKPKVAEPKSLRDYVVQYRIAPYVFEMEYENAEMGRLLGLPSYDVYSNLTAENIALLAQYNSMLEQYWGDFGAIALPAAPPVYYAIPAFGRNHISADRQIDVAYPADGEGFLNEYLPAYELVSIDVYSGSDVIKHFTQDDILRVVIFDGELLANVTALSDISLSYTYESIAPKMESASRLPGRLGVEEIYSDLANTMVIDIEFEK